MKKKVSRVVNTEINTNAFLSNSDLPTPESVENFAEQLTGKIKTEIKKLEMAGNPSEKSKTKKTTDKGTEVVNLMIESELLTQAKLKAVYNRKTVSSIVNAALRQYIYPTIP